MDHDPLCIQTWYSIDNKSWVVVVMVLGVAQLGNVGDSIVDYVSLIAYLF